MADDGNLGNVLRALDQVKRQIVADVEKALDKSVDEIIAAIKAVTPVDDVDGGQLRDSIRVLMGDHQLSRMIVAGDIDAAYARFVNFGANGVKPTNFFWGVWRLLKRRVVARVNRSPAATIARFNRG